VTPMPARPSSKFKDRRSKIEMVGEKDSAAFSFDLRTSIFDLKT